MKAAGRWGGMQETGEKESMWVMGRDAGRKNMGIVQTILWKERLHELKKLIEREWMVQTEMKK